MQTRSGVDRTAPTSVKVAETAFGKSINISRGKDGRMFRIDVEGGGLKPPVLDGMFTRWSDAEHAVKVYVDGGKGRYAKKGDPMPTSFMATEPSNADPGDAVAE